MSKQTGSEQLLTISDVAQFFARSTRTVTRWIETGELQAFDLSASSTNKSWRIKRKWLDDFVLMRSNCKRTLGHQSPEQEVAEYNERKRR